MKKNQRKKGVIIRKDNSRKFIKCYNLTLKAEHALYNKEGSIAKRAYSKARDVYIKLEYHEKTEIYNELNQLYNKIRKFAI